MPSVPGRTEEPTISSGSTVASGVLLGARDLWQVTLPIIVSNLLSLALLVVDAALLGHFSTNDLAAATLGFPVYMVMQMPATGWATAVQVLVARRWGENDPAAVARIARLGVLIGGGGGLLCGVVTILAAGVIARLLTDDPFLAQRATDYLRVIALALPLIGLLSVLRACYAGLGKTAVVMRVTSGVVLANVPLNLFWILLVGLGAVGSALGTVLVLAGGVGALLWHSHARLSPALPVKGDLHGWRETVARLWQIGWPESVMLFAGYLNALLVMWVVAELGVVAVAVAGILGALLNVIWTVIFACSSGVSVLAGQRLGARDLVGAEVVERAGYLITGGCVAALVTPMLALPHLVLRLFTDDASVAAQAASVLPLMLLQTPLMVLGMVLAGMLRAAGDTKTLLVAATVGAYLVYLPLAWVLATQLGLGLSGVYLGAVAFWVARGGLTLIRYRQGAWRTARL
ncbi:MAG: MATE family efflux transporter [Dehalococcoidia bacterium]|nr:MAG: MATE family efflux transporter [Dehalococcoidia bacterium]